MVVPVGLEPTTL